MLVRCIFKWFIQDDASSRITWFAAKFGPEEFEEVDKLLAVFLEYCAELDIVAERKYLIAFMKTEGKKHIVAHNIKVQSIDNFDYSDPSSLEEAYQVLLSTVLSTYDEYVKESIEDESFAVDMKLFMSTKKAERTLKIMADAFPKISNGTDIDLAIEDMQYKLDKTQLVYDTEYIKKLDFLEGKKSAGGNKNCMKFICRTGMLCVDGDAGGIYTSQIHAFTGSPGSGKTRYICSSYIYHALTEAKVDVLLDELELKDVEIENMIIAHHIVNLYGGKIKIPDSVMNTGNMSEEQKQYYEAARIDLFESGKYGKLTIRTDELIVERMKKDMYTYLRKNRKTMLWVIDYAGLATSKPIDKYAKHLDGYEIIRELYKGAKDIAKVADIGVVIVNQFTKEGNQAAAAGKRIMPGHVEGGQIVERHADYDYVMCMTEEQELANRCTFSTVKKRAAAGFQNVPVMTDRSVSIFKQIRDD